MNKYKSNIEMNTRRKSDVFRSIWNHEKQPWQKKAEETVPDDATILRLAEEAKHQAGTIEVMAIPAVSNRRMRWVPYLAAASLLTGAVLIGVNRYDNVDNSRHIVQEVNVEGHTMFFMCNNGCSAQDIFHAAYDVINN